jgi:hyperosmotically inducible protein
MTTIRHLRLLSVAVLAVLALAACSTTNTRSAGETFDDTSITTQVKAKLAAEKIATLTRVNVDTNMRTVYLNGTVDSEEMRHRAESIAREVKGVNAVVNNLSVKTSG